MRYLFLIYWSLACQNISQQLPIERRMLSYPNPHQSVCVSCAESVTGWTHRTEESKQYAKRHAVESASQGSGDWLKEGPSFS